MSSVRKPFPEPIAAQPDRAAAAAYVGSLSGDLATIARRHGLDTLAYLLDIAQLEAENAARSQRKSGGTH